MVKPQLGHDQVVFEWRWSLNTGGHKSMFHCIVINCMQAIAPRQDSLGMMDQSSADSLQQAQPTGSTTSTTSSKKLDFDSDSLDSRKKKSATSSRTSSENFATVHDFSEKLAKNSATSCSTSEFVTDFSMKSAGKKTAYQLSLSRNRSMLSPGSSQRGGLSSDMSFSLSQTCSSGGSGVVSSTSGSSPSVQPSSSSLSGRSSSSSAPTTQSSGQSSGTSFDGPSYGGHDCDEDTEQTHSSSMQSFSSQSSPSSRRSAAAAGGGRGSTTASRDGVARQAVTPPTGHEQQASASVDSVALLDDSIFENIEDSDIEVVSPQTGMCSHVMVQVY